VPARPGAAGREARPCATRALKRLDAYELLICDDLGYVQQSPVEIEVLFTLISERYERRSMLITSNLVFSEWDRIFNNPHRGSDRPTGAPFGDPRVRGAELPHRRRSQA
jgi:DNA replication protein DnaC